MTRYFNYAYMTFDQFMSMKSAKYLSWRNAPDGVVILLMPGEELNEELIAKHAAEIGDQCLIVCLPNAKETCDEKAKYLLAVQSLANVAKKENRLKSTNYPLRLRYDLKPVLALFMDH